MTLQSPTDPTPQERIATDDGADDKQRNNRSVITRLYDRFGKRLTTSLKNHFGPGPPCPEDVAHQAFTKLSERESVDDIRDLDSFMWVTASNIMRSEIRKLRVRADYAQDRLHVPWGDECDDFDAERVLLAKEALDIVADILLQMPERRRQIFIMCRIEGMTPAAAGEAIGVSRSSAVRHVSVATQTLVEALAGAGRIEPDPVAE